MKKQLLSLALALAFMLSFLPALPATAADDPGTYNPGDIAVINAIIDNNGLQWEKAPVDGSSVPADWTGVTWTNDATDKRIIELDITDKSLDGALDVTGLTALERLWCNDNLLTELDVSNNTALEALVCFGNQLTALDVSSNIALILLDCGGNRLTALDVSNNPVLSVLFCRDNQLTALDVSNNTALEALVCDNNQLTELDVSNNTALAFFNCNNNQLTELDVSNNTALEWLWCGNNQLTGLTLNATAPYVRISVGYNYMPSESAVTGQAIAWDDVDFIFNPQFRIVRFVDWDGTEIYKQSVPHNWYATAPANPSRAGYTFTGWDVVFTNVTSDLTVTAVYTQDTPTLPPFTPPTPDPDPDPEPPVVTDDKTAVVTAPEGEDTASIPNRVLNQIRQGTLQLEIGFTDEDGEALGTMVFSAEAAGKMISDATGGGINVSLKTVEPDDLDLSGLSDDQAEAVAGRPVYEFTVTDANNRPITQFGGNVTITLPYTLAEGENPNAIIIYYLTDEGIKIVRGYYDAAAQTVIITTNHFSKYVVGYNDVTFTDVPKDHPNKAAIDFLAAREITVGYGGGIFGLNDELTRAQLLVMVLKAYGIEEDKTLENTFDDAEGKWFEYWTAMAKDLGITAGVGNNNFGEEPAKFEQVLLWIYRTLDAIGETLPDAETVKLAGFAGADTFSDWVWLDGNDRKLEAVLEAVGFDGDDLDPQGYCERALMAQLLYNMMTR